MHSPELARALNIWIVNPYGWLPGEGWRDYRNLPLVQALVARGHQVRWWISDIEHRSRTRRQVRDFGLLLPPGLTLELVESQAYDRNISLARIRHERSFAAGFGRKAASLPSPDVIVLADPALFFGGKVVHYARARNVPFVLDVIDLWPELFRILLPRPLRNLDHIVFAPLYRRRDRVVARAAAVVAVTADYLQQVTRRVKPAFAEVVYLGRERSAFRHPTLNREEGAMLEVVYAGNLGDAYDMPTLMTAIERLAKSERPVRFTLAGDGPWRERASVLAVRFPAHVRFLGRVAPEALPEHFAHAQIGLATYAAGSTVSMPTKLFDYLAAGLATVGSMGGEAAALLNEGAGRRYRAGSADDLVAALEYYLDRPAELAAARRFAFSKAHMFEQARQYERFALLIEKAAGS